MKVTFKKKNKLILIIIVLCSSILAPFLAPYVLSIFNGKAVPGDIIDFDPIKAIPQVTEYAGEGFELYSIKASNIKPDGVMDLKTNLALLKSDAFYPHVEYVFYKKNRWEFSLPLSIGIGNTRYEYLYNNTEFQRDKKIVVICETGVSGDYKLFSWLGIGMGAGYRLMIIDNKAIDENFNSIIYILKIKLFLSEIWRNVWCFVTVHKAHW